MADAVGFIGLGIMGRPMAKNLMEAGYELVVHNRSPEKAEELAEEGDATAAGSPREVAEACDIVITMLPDSPDVEAVVAGEDGVLEGIRDGALLVDMSTISPVVTEELSEKVREQGASMLDAPVSGGDVGAIEGALSIMVGGSEEDFERARPLFDVMGKVATHVGPTGAGQVVKACNQIVVALNIEAVSEALVLGLQGRRRAGEAGGGALRGAGWQRGDGGQEGEVLLPRLRAGFQDRIAPQGSGYSPCGGQGVRCGPAGHGHRGPDARSVEGQGPGRQGPLGATHLAGGSRATRDRGGRLRLPAEGGHTWSVAGS